MKRAFSAVLMASSALAATEGGGFVTGQVVKLKRASVVYSQASAKSKPLADVDPGTMLLLIDVSPRKTWLFVQDEDNHRGWVPAKFTDFRGDLAADDKKDEPEESNEVREQHEESSRGVPHPNVLETGVRKAFSDPNGDWAWLARYTRYFWADGPLAFGLMAGYDGYLGGKRGGASIPLRVKVQNFETGRGTSFTVDAGAYFMRDPDPKVGWSTSGSLGLTSNVLYSSGFTYGLRLGLDFAPGTRFGLEWNLGWTF